MTLEEAIKETRAILAEPQEGFFKDSEITTWLNEGNKDFHNKKGINDIWTITIDSPTTEIPLDPAMFKINRLYYQSTAEANQTQIPSIEYQIFRSTIIFNTQHSPGTYICYGEKLPADITVTTSSFEIDDEFVHALPLYAAAMGFIKDNNPFYNVVFPYYLELKRRWEKKTLDPTDRVQIKLRKGW